MKTSLFPTSAWLGKLWRSKYRWLLFLCTGVVIPVLAAFSIPVYAKVAFSAVMVRNLAYAKQMALGFKLYAQDHDENLPASVAELAPDYLPDADLQKIRYHDPDTGIDYDWCIYLTSLKVSDDRLLLSSPFPYRTKDGIYQRIVARADTTGMILRDQDFTSQLAAQMRALTTTPHVPGKSPSNETRPPH